LNESLWKVDDYQEFLKARRRLIADAINEFMDSLLVNGDSTALTVQDLIAQGESKEVEFKSSLRWDLQQSCLSKGVQKAVSRTLAAFLNSDGGTLLIGVADDGVVLGLASDLKTLGKKQNRDGFELSLRNLLSSQLGAEASAAVELTFSEEDGKLVAVASCVASPHPVYLTDGSDVSFFIRDGNLSRRLNISESHQYIASHWPFAGAAAAIA
jgi:predicted HTH transcriptional regulator